MTTFVDTSFLIAIALQDDALHARAAAWDAALVGRCLTTEFVLLELADALCAPELRVAAKEFIDRIRQDPRVEILPANAELLSDGYRLYGERADKGWSLTDCISFNIMRTRGITDALTYDHHFEQAGFRALLRQDPPAN